MLDKNGLNIHSNQDKFLSLQKKKKLKKCQINTKVLWLELVLYQTQAYTLECLTP